MKNKNGPGMAYNMKKLNKVFAFLSVLFVAVTFWVFLDDYIRPWKAIQIESMKIRKQKIDRKIALANKEIDQDKLDQLNSEKAKAETSLEDKKERIDQLKSKYAELNRDKQSETIVNGKLNSSVAATNFKYEVSHSHGKIDAHDLFVKLRKLKGLFAESKDRLKAITVNMKETQKQIVKEMAGIVSNEKLIKDILGKRDLLFLAKSKVEMSPIFVLRNLPMIDYLDPTLKIEQIVVKNLVDDRYFKMTEKVDRCITCHTNIDDPDFKDEVNPHKSHPRLDLMVGLDSKHPMKKIGCTVCHGGEGHRVSNFNVVEHTPQDDKQKKVWVEKYGWRPAHHVQSPMLKLQHTEGSCLKCHSGVELIPGGTVVNEGRRNIEKFGCNACHKIEGWEHKRKPGPSLEKIASKIDKEFFKAWVWNPKAFNKHTTMPSFFMQDNNKSEEFSKKNIAEINAIAEYVWEKSKKYSPFKKYTGGNKARGKGLIKSVGCMGCHGVEGLEDESKKIDAYAGPYLTGTGSKVTADWLMSWLIKPSHYQENTIMPSFRLSQREAGDITAYLMSLRNDRYNNLTFDKLDGKVRDEILLTYFSAFDTMEIAKKKIIDMSDRDKTLELGHRSIGKYGCYSCHDMEGFDGRSPIGPELTSVGSKPITQFGFGHEYDVEHSKSGWIKAHLLNPRRWDNGIDKPFKDLLRMPNFHMSEKEADSITASLMGQVSEYIPIAAQKQMNEYELVTAKGMKTLNKFNCMGCHQVDGVGGDILAKYEDDINEGPPRLVGQGHRVKADWFHHFLGNVYPIRPWLKVRMPSFNFSNEEKNNLVEMFQAKSEQQTFEKVVKRVSWEPGELNIARRLFKELDCASCHTSGFNSSEATAPDLRGVKDRLRASWIKKWLQDPQAIMPGTVMPSFWEDGESMSPDILGGDADKQIDILVKYLIHLGNK